MSKLIILSLVIFATSSVAATSHGNHPDSKPDKKTTVSEFTAYGRAEITFYPSGAIKKVKCRPPYNVVCFTVTHSTNQFEVHESGSILPTHVFISSGYSIGSESGDTTVEFPEN